MKILSVVGARPNFMKIAPIISAIEEHNSVTQRSELKIEHILLHTGQHYDESMSDTFFSDLDLPRPDIFLGIGSASHAIQTAKIMESFEKVLLQEKPDVVIVAGDVNSTLACALVASKIEYPITQSSNQPDMRRPLVAHVEAGLRSFDRSMPEETNRVLTDHLSDILFVSEPSGLENLKREGIVNFLNEEDMVKLNINSQLNNDYSLPLAAFVGNTMIDTMFKHKQKAQQSNILHKLGLIDKLTKATNPYAVLTLHRPSNVDNKQIFLNILEALTVISKNIQIIFPCHPRTLKRIEEFNFELYFDGRSSGHCHHAGGNCGIHCVEPLGYLDFLCLMSNAKLILTDSGGIQEESTILGISCVTLRENTERPITVNKGTNIVAGTEKEAIVAHSLNQLHNYNDPINPSTRYNYVPLWDGLAAKRIVAILVNKIIQSS